MSNTITSPAEETPAIAEKVAKRQKIDDNVDDTSNVALGDCITAEKELQSTLWKAGSYMSLHKTDFNVVLRHAGKNTKFSNQPPIKLGYFPIRALAFLPQLILEESGASYEYHLLGGDSFKKLKANLPFGRMPIIFDWHAKGDHLAQSGAIIRALSTKLGFVGTNSWEENQCDMLFEQLKEGFNKNHYSVAALKLGVAENEDLTKVPQWENMSRVNEYSDFQKSVSILKCFEALLQKNTNKVLVGSQLTYIDLALWSKLLELSQPDSVPDWAAKLKLPHLNEFYLRIIERPNIKAFLNSGRLLPRIGEGYKFRPGIFCKAESEEKS